MKLALKITAPASISDFADRLRILLITFTLEKYRGGAPLVGKSCTVGRMVDLRLTNHYPFSTYLICVKRSVAG
jgi:hypothetical protein